MARAHAGRNLVSIRRGPWRSSSSSDGLILVQLPVPRQKLVEARGRKVSDAGEHVSEPGLRIDVVEFGCGDQRVDRRGTLARIGR